MYTIHKLRTGLLFEGPITEELCLNYSFRQVGDKLVNRDERLFNLLYRNYDVFIFELCDGDLSQLNKTQSLTLRQSKHICKQLLTCLMELEESKQSHNDLKPGNVLYNVKDLDEDNNAQYSIKLGDFGTVNRSGGTPGWTWPKFLTERKPGKSDMYSTGMLILYVMCENEQIFYKLRNNYVEHPGDWLSEFRKDPLIKFVIDMRNLNLTVQECRDQWDKIHDQLEIISEDFLIDKIGTEWLRTQDNIHQLLLTSVDTSILGKSSLSSPITQSMLEGQDGSLLCWNFAISQSIHQSMFLRLGRKV